MTTLSRSARLGVMPHAPSSTTATLPEAFVAEARETISVFCSYVDRLLEGSPRPIGRATDLKLVLGVRMSLAWQIFKITQIEDTLDAVTYIPRPDAMKRLLAAAEDAGFSKEAVWELTGAYERFAEFVNHHAGDRGSFDAMIAALGGQAAEQVDLRDRRAAFRAESNIWGVQSRMLYRCVVRHRSEDVSSDNVVLVSGSMGLRALRRVPSLPLIRRAIVLKGRSSEAQLRQPNHPIKLLGEFCTHPTPVIETTEIGGPSHEMLQFSGVGQTSRIDCFVQEEFRGLKVDDDTEGLSTGAFVHSPCEHLVLDMLLPEGWCDPVTAAARTYGNVAFVEQAALRSDELLMPSKETVRHLGTSIDALHDKLFPRAPQLVRHVLKDQGWVNTEFDIFRCVVRYPILHSAVEVSVDFIDQE